MFKSQISTVAKGAAGAAKPIDDNEISLLNCQYLILLLACGMGTDIQHAPCSITLESWTFRRAEVSTAALRSQEELSLLKAHRLEIFHVSPAPPEAQEKPNSLA